ncbi:MAG: thioredoxin family protein [Bacteroidales bacterium]
MKKSISIFIIIVALLPKLYAQEVSLIKWYSLQEALELNAKQPKKIFIDVYTDWCGWCKVMDKNTFHNSYIAEYLSKNFYPVKFNAEGTEDLTYKGQVFKNKNQGQRSTHDFAIALLKGKMSYPTIAFLDSSSTPITYISGYLTPEQIEPLLVFINNDLYKSEKWEDFLSKFESKLPK